MPLVSPEIKRQLQLSASKAREASKANLKVQETQRKNREEIEDLESQAAEAHIKRVYSALPRSSFPINKLLADPSVKKHGLTVTAPLSLDLLYAPSSPASSHSSFEDIA